MSVWILKTMVAAAWCVGSPLGAMSNTAAVYCMLERSVMASVLAGL